MQEGRRVFQSCSLSSKQPEKWRGKYRRERAQNGRDANHDSNESRCETSGLRMLARADQTTNAGAKSNGHANGD
ncbi:hypothetical protein AA0229_1168 [Gluconobacter cerinus NRIC 0229]|nr:hypothetical protein AA0229_1168 [Gluconobacter cerinus NRIC 0229]